MSTHFMKTHPGTDLAIQANRVDRASGAIWLEIHRVAEVQDLQSGMHLFITDCDRLFLLADDARSLMTGFIGAKCPACWAHLPVEDVAA